MTLFIVHYVQSIGIQFLDAHHLMTAMSNTTLVSLQAPPSQPVAVPEAVPPLPSRPWHSQVRGRERREGEGKREREERM